MITATRSAPAAENSAPRDESLVEQTRRHIHQLAREIAELSQSDLAPEAFRAQFLARLVAATGATAAAWWQRRSGAWHLVTGVHLEQVELAPATPRQAAYAKLLAETSISQLPRYLPPADDPAGRPRNGSEHALLLAGFAIRAGEPSSDVAGEVVVQVFRRPAESPAAQRGCLDFLSRMTALASDYYARRGRPQKSAAPAWRALEQALRDLHGAGDFEERARLLAESSRRILDCGRVSVAWRREGRVDVIAISGAPTIDARGEDVQRVRRAAEATMSAGKRLFATATGAGRATADNESLANLLASSKTRAAAAFPLKDPVAGQVGGKTSVCGALVCEHFEHERFSDSASEQAEVLAAHGALALTRPERSRDLSPATQSTRRRLVRLALVGTLAILAGALALLPAPLRTAARGKLLAAHRYDVFAHVDGTVHEVLARHAQQVEAGEVLARMQSTDLAVQISDLVGQRDRTLEQLQAREQLLLQSSDLSALAQQQLAGEVLELKQALTTAEQRLRLYREKQQRLTITSPIRGQVVTWNVEDALLRRPVRAGQVLMSVIDPEGPWELELYVPERRFGQLLDAMHASNEPLEVRFQVHSQSGQEFTGRVVEYHRLAEMRDDGNSIAVRVAINKDDLPQLHHEATVSAQIHCGTRSLGVVLFQDVIETVHNAWLYWF